MWEWFERFANKLELCAYRSGCCTTCPAGSDRRRHPLSVSRLFMFSFTSP
jgi:hypothetical protein